MKIKGIAIILMMCNHLFPIPEFIYPENNYFSLPFGGKTIAAYIGGFGKICVAIFAFLTGIAMFYTYSRTELKKKLGSYLEKIAKFSRYILDDSFCCLFTDYIFFKGGDI